MKVGCLLSVREKATRLQGKVLLPVAGMPLTLFLLKRISLSQNIDDIILSTSIHPDDDGLVKLAEENNYSSFRGSEDDKLKRYYDTAQEYGLDAVVIVDGDDPFCFPEYIDAVAKELKKGEADYVYVSGLPVGGASSGLSVAGIKAVLEAKANDNTEVWGGYFLDNPQIRTREIIADKAHCAPDVRLTVDYPPDYELVTAIIECIGEDELQFSSEWLVDVLLNKNPELVKINEHVHKDYLEHLEKSTEVKFKSN